MNCVKCEKELKKSDKGKWESAIVDTIAATQGSEHAGEKFQIGICDECIEDNPHLVRIQDNYMTWTIDDTWQ